MPYHRRRTHAAFTLVELLVVVGIIALLIAILMPALSKAREQANAVKCMSNERQLGQALVMFTNDHNGYLPKAWFNDGPVAGKGGWNYRDPMYGWTYLLLRYVGNNKETFRCPSDDTGYVYDTFNDSAANLPDRGDADNIPGSYRLNISDLPNGPFDAIRATRLGNTSEAIVIADAKQGYMASQWNQLARWEDWNGRVSKQFKDNVAWKRHRNRGMYVFADGHAENLSWDETWAQRGPDIPGGAIGGTTFVTMWRHNYEGATKGWKDFVP
jgi:prepilin-type processing-associated H-X9-DG protein/prepilin-type N-terminal cleavage/methylation domain-containing protein